jgi:2,3-dihydroxybenzoate decarboxylase
MDQSGVDYMILSCASPCIQGVSDPVEAESLATGANNDLAALISNNTMRFGAFAALSMHNATAAGIELRRAVTELGFLGALVNDYQQSGADNGDSIPSYLKIQKRLNVASNPALLRRATIRRILVCRSGA